MVNSEPIVRLPDSNASEVSSDSVAPNLTRNAPPLELGKFVDKACLGVFLLTGNLELAEIAVTTCIDVVEVEDLTELLPLSAARLALQLQRNGWKQTANTRLTMGALPIELDCVLQLPANLRQCFVLRLLSGAAIPVCADILQMESEYIGASAGVAALELARAIAPKSALFQDVDHAAHFPPT
jgi:hypothetical protein